MIWIVAPIIAGSHNVKLHPRKIGIDPSSLARFDPASLALVGGRVCKPGPGVHCTTPRCGAALLSSCCAGWLLHCLSSCPFIFPLQRLVVASSLGILLLHPLLVNLLPPLLVALPLVILLLGRLLGFSLRWLVIVLPLVVLPSCPFVAPPSWPLIALAGH
jgi:hypothetical protein